MENYTDIIKERLSILESEKELQLAIEGRTTNLRIFTGKNENGKYSFKEHNTVYLRLDKFQNYSAPLKEDTFNYLENKDTPVKQLLKFGFSSSINNLPEILEITKGMKIRECLQW